MKLNLKSIFLGVLGLMMAGSIASCSEDATLDGAKVVYITMNPTDITLRIGDTIKVSATVTNLSGDIIDTPIKWSVLDESVAKMVGDSAIVCVNGGQGKSTKVKAELENGRYGLANVTVTTNLPQGITPVDEYGVAIPHKVSYYNPHDSVVFAINPKILLYDFTPTFTCKDVEIVEPRLTINYEAGTAAVHFASPRKAGEGSITLSIGDESTGKQATCKILFTPNILATFYGEKYANMPYLGTRPDKSTLPMWFAYQNETTMDVNSEATVRVAMNVSTGAKEDIEAAYGSYRWECVDGSSVIVTRQDEEYVEGQGFDAVLTVRSGLEEGVTEFHCITPDTVLVAVFDVKNYVQRYPVEQITVDKESISIPVGGREMLTTGTIPSSSYAYHKPVITVENPSLVSVSEYDGNMVTIVGLAVGSTNLILTSNGKTLKVPVTITEGISNVKWRQGNKRTIFEGQSVTWGVEAVTTSGSANPYPVTWISSDVNIAKAAQVADDNSLGTVTGVAKGKATIVAEVLGVKSDAAEVTIVSIPSNSTFVTSDVDPNNTGAYTEGNDIVLLITPNSGSVNMYTITVKGGATGGIAGNYTSGIIVDADGASAEAAGSLTFAAAGGDFSLNMDLTVTVGDKQFKLNANGLTVANWQ